MEKLFVYVHGSARGAPGEAAIGIVLTDADGTVIEERSQLIGRSTPAVTEYRALIEGCRLAAEYAPESVILFTDNQQLANHVNGVFHTRRPNLTHLMQEAKALLNGFPQWRVNYIDRAANRRAPRLVDRAYHSRTQERIARQRLQSLLLARTAELTEDDLRRLIEFAESLQAES
jgi:ribonuclease HI